MHGVIFAELRKYVETRLGADAWGSLLKEAGMPGKMFLSTQEYPDAGMVALVGAATRVTGLGADAILQDFGEFIAPDLIAMFGMSIKPQWRTLDLLENTEQTIHKAVRVRNPGAKPPELVCVRDGPGQVTITYSSPRKLCGVAKGIIAGVAKHYGDSISVAEPACMHRGASSCKIVVKGR